jgi:hypothetical protein
MNNLYFVSTLNLNRSNFQHPQIMSNSTLINSQTLLADPIGPQYMDVEKFEFES